MLFDKETYTARRDRLKRQVKEGLILLFGNNDAPSNYPANVYKYRQDSMFSFIFTDNTAKDSWGNRHRQPEGIPDWKRYRH